MSATPLRVEWKLSRPVIARQHEIQLDALLDWAAVEENGGDWRIPRELTLESYKVGVESVFKASSIVFHQDAAARLMHMVRRVSADGMVRDIERGLLHMRANSISSGSGHLKGYSWLAHTQPCSSAVAWCVGDEDRVLELLGRVRSLGKLSRNSMGLIQEFSVSHAPSDETERWMLRTMPSGFEFTPEASRAAEMGIVYGRAQGRLKAPYWLPEKTDVLDPIDHRFSVF